MSKTVALSQLQIWKAGLLPQTGLPLVAAKGKVLNAKYVFAAANTFAAGYVHL